MTQRSLPCILALLALPLMAQDKGFSLHGALVAGADSLHKATNARTGLVASASCDGTIPGADVAVRTSLGWAHFPGSRRDGLRTNLTLIQLSGDLQVPFTARVSGILGLSANRWTLARSGEETETRAFPVQDSAGLKFGLRAGVACRLTEHLALEGLFQQVELAGRDRDDPRTRAGGINPAWLQVGARYRF